VKGGKEEKLAERDRPWERDKLMFTQHHHWFTCMLSLPLYQSTSR